MKPNKSLTAWKIAYWLLFAAWAAGAAMTMAKVKGGFLTSYLADIAFPAWYYIVMRGLANPERNVPFLLRWFGRSPERAALSIFVVGVAYELIQLYVPTSPIAGTFDPLDIAAYAVSVGTCYLCEKKSTPHF